MTSFLDVKQIVRSILDFQTKEITIDEIILPMRDINSLIMSKMERAWSVNNSMAHEPQSTQEATKQVFIS